MKETILQLRETDRIIPYSRLYSRILCMYNLLRSVSSMLTSCLKLHSKKCRIFIKQKRNSNSSAPVLQQL